MNIGIFPRNFVRSEELYEDRFLACGDDFVCRCPLDSVAIDAALAKLDATGRARLELSCTIDGDDKPAVSFTGRYVVHAKRD